MSNTLSVIKEKNLQVGDMAVLYVTTCSDVDASLENSRCIVECQVIGKLPAWDKATDDRYIVRCAKNLRDRKVVNGSGPNEALVSKFSPFLMTWEEYQNYTEDPILLSRWLSDVSQILMGYDVPDYMLNWQTEAANIMEELEVEPKDVVCNVMDDFSPKYGKALVAMDDFLIEFDSQAASPRP